MEYAFLFPGQGSQKVGMGKDLRDAFPLAAERFSEADAIAGREVSALCFEGPEENLKKTENTQPALFAVEAIICDLLADKGLTPSVTMGHSLGEYAALYAAGVFSFADGMKLVAKRGELMSAAGEQSPGSMAAIIGLPREKILEICSGLSRGTAVPANENTPEQTVISGETPAVEEAAERMKAAGAKRAIILPVSGAFHSPLMQPAAEEFAGFLETIGFHAPKCPVIANVTAAEETDGNTLKKLLVRQLVSPVRWVDSVACLRRRSAITCVEMGPGNILKGLMRKIEREIEVISCESAENIYSLSNRT